MKVTGYTSPIATHPGETLTETLEFLNMTPNDLAIKTGLDIKLIKSIMYGKRRVTPSVAGLLEKALDVKKTFWLNLQTGYDKDRIRLKEWAKAEKKGLIGGVHPAELYIPLGFSATKFKKVLGVLRKERITRIIETNRNHENSKNA